MAGVIAVVGATATGKSALAMALAGVLGGEIVNADSRQVYRYMDIGTAKPPSQDRSRVPHHLIDILDPNGSFNLALYLRLATQAVDGIHSRGRVPLLVGGSGLYVWGFLEGLRIPHVPPDQKLRAELELQAQVLGPQALHQRLREVDPDAAASINPSNVRRVIRALEVWEKSGAPFSKLVSKDGPSHPFLVIGLRAPREVLYLRTDGRVDAMIEAGLVKEVGDLLARGYSLDLPSMSSVGYKQIGMYLQGHTSLEEAIQKTKYETHRLARHQEAWFKAEDPRIHWYDITAQFTEEVLEEAEAFLSCA